MWLGRALVVVVASALRCGAQGGASRRPLTQTKAGTWEEVVAALRDDGHVSLTYDVEVARPVVVTGITATLTSIGSDMRVLDGGHAHRLLIVESGSRLRLDHLRLARGSSLESGGAVAVDDALVEMIGCEITSNRAFQGGAIYLGRGASLVATDTRFVDNTAAGRGGAVYARGLSSVAIVGGALVANEAHRGGAVYVYGSKLACSRAVVERNKARDAGGAIYVDRQSKANASHSVFLDNDAWEGPSIFVADHSSSDTTNCSGVDAYARGDSVTVCLGAPAGPQECSSHANPDALTSVFGRAVRVDALGSTSISTFH